MGSSCSRVRRESSSNHYNCSSSARPSPQIGDNSDGSAVFCRENVAPVDFEDESSNIILEFPFTSSNAQSSVSSESSNNELRIFSDGNGERNAEECDQVAYFSESQPLHTSQSLNTSHSIHDLESSFTDVQSDLNSENADIALNNSDLVSRSLGSGSATALYLLGIDSSRDTPSLSSQDLYSRTEAQDLGSVLHIDMVSISSNSHTDNIREVGNRQLSRGRRSFWDIFSRLNFRRHSHNPAIDDTDDLGVHGRFLLDSDSGRQIDWTSHDRVTRSNNRNEQGESRLGRLEGVHPMADEEESHIHLCIFGLHPHGTCLCDSQFMGDEFGAFIIISRIVILFEAINELLDEISSQAMPFSLSTLSLPAPESIVDSFPLKNHKSDVTDATKEIQQCHICLSEYEEGDKIRVLPCKHEYHMACVDKWLKEVHGVCPLCRADVCVGCHSESTSETES